jgi:proline racemase
VIDVPSGRVTARVSRAAGRTVGVEFLSVPSFVLGRDIPVETSRGEVRVDVSFGGAIYAQVPAAALDLAVEPQHLPELIAVGREIKAGLEGTPYAAHPDDPRLSGIYGTILFDDLGGLRQRNVTIFADGQVDRSPCGSGTAARMATLDHDLVHSSIVGSVFEGSIVDRVTAAGRPAVVPSIRGTAFRTGDHVFHVDPHDDLVPGFVLR